MAAISWDPSVLSTLTPRPTHRSSPLLHSYKVEHSGFLNGGVTISNTMPQNLRLPGKNFRCQSNLTFGVSGDDKMSIRSITEDAESLLLNALTMSFFERLSLAWKIIFPSQERTKKSSAAAHIAKQRLKMILFSDRCAVSDEAKRKIVKSIVTALSDFVEIDSQENVQLSVSTDYDLGTVYSVTVPVRRVKPEYQDDDDEPSITNIEYKDNGETSGSVDVRFDFYIPNDSSE